LSVAHQCSTFRKKDGNLLHRLAPPVILAVCCLMIGSAVGTPATSVDEISGLLSRYAESGGRFKLPALSGKDLQSVSQGESVVRVSAESGGAGADEVVASQTFGFQIVEAPRLHAWLALLGGSGEGKEGRYTRAMLTRLPEGAYVRYQHLDLPWPFKDRHWVIRCEKNAALAKRSDGRIWEHYWSLEADGKDLLRRAMEAGRIAGIRSGGVNDAIYLPANRGAWILFDLGAGRTLVVAHVDVDFGGAIPDGVLRAFAQHQLRSGFEALKQSSVRAHLEYKADPQVHDGFGLPIPVQAAQAEASS
jgi:hypothetical protein